MPAHKIKFQPTLDNVLSLMGRKLAEYKGGSRRSYQKAFSSFQIYVVSNYSLSLLLGPEILKNWVVNNLIQELSYKTVSFYLDKLSSLYTRIAPKLQEGRLPFFKEVKAVLKNCSPEAFDTAFINDSVEKVVAINSNVDSEKFSLPELLRNLPYALPDEATKNLEDIWACLALKAGVRPDHLVSILGKSPVALPFLEIFPASELSEECKREVCHKIDTYLKGDPPGWFAMRLRPKVKFETLLHRLSQFNSDEAIPELFYPYQDIARKVGRRLVWEGRPAIRDVVFFKLRKKEIYPLFTRIYDLAWCYRNPGNHPGNYASIPETAMMEFKKALGTLTPDFDVMPAGQMTLKPGDKVVILKGEYEAQLAEVVKKSNESDAHHTIYRVTLLNSNTRWDIGIDARLLKKT